MMKILFGWLYALVRRIKIADADKAIADAKALSVEYKAAIAKANTIYTTVRSFYDDPASYWQWVKSVVNADQWGYLLFQLRENVIREMAGCTEEKILLKHLGRLEMLNVIANYLRTGVNEYEDSLRRSKEGS